MKRRQKEDPCKMNSNGNTNNNYYYFSSLTNRIRGSIGCPSPTTATTTAAPSNTVSRQQTEAVNNNDVIAEVIQELQQLVSSSQQQDPETTKAYQLAVEQNRQYCHNPAFIMKFVYAEQNRNPKHVALRIVRHFESKQQLFGCDKLTKNIAQDDFSQEDIQILYSGSAQILPYLRDNDGRAIGLQLAPLVEESPSCISLVSQEKKSDAKYFFQNIGSLIETSFPPPSSVVNFTTHKSCQKMFKYKRRGSL